MFLGFLAETFPKWPSGYVHFGNTELFLSLTVFTLHTNISWQWLDSLTQLLSGKEGYQVKSPTTLLHFLPYHITLKALYHTLNPHLWQLRSIGNSHLC